jgi:glycosyltransferase involved in cell wall biosynthesis
MGAGRPFIEEISGMPTSRAHDDDPDRSRATRSGVDRHPPDQAGTESGTPLRVCIVSNGLLGPVRNGGIATLSMGMAEALLAASHEVTYLYTGESYTETRPVEHWVEHYARRGLAVVPLPELEVPILASPELRLSYLTYEWLRARDAFDIIHFQEWRGNGYYSLLAKHQGLAFQRTTLCVGTHGPSCWIKQGNHEFMAEIQDLEVDYLERRSVALAEVLVSSSRYMLDWLTEQGWRLPNSCCVLPNLLPSTAPTDHHRRSTMGNGEACPQDVEEFVFFGRLETRKGLVLFCDALDRLESRGTKPFRATFLGKPGTVLGQPVLDYIVKRSHAWRFPWKAITTLDNREALDYLRQPGRLAVMPSLMDNSPLALHECLLAGVPFLASQVGGIPEMMHVEDRRRVLFPPRADDLAERMEAALRGGLACARPAFDEEASRAAWLAWHREAGRRDRATARTAEDRRPLPRVSVCLPHFNRPHYLRQALASLAAQDYPDFEVIVVDDGSTLPEAIAYLDAIESELAARGWRIIRQENRYPGAARNHAARHARGEYLLFMDDDNIAKPHEISRFVRAALTSGSDILTCCAEIIRGTELHHPDRRPYGRWLYLGDSLAVSVFYNCFGDTNALVRRSAFLALGGFTEDYGYNHEDKELYTRAILEGYHLEVVPEALYWYREHTSGINLSSSRYLNVMRGLRPYRTALPESLYQVLIYVNDLHHKPLPLRYRIVDRINLGIKWFAPIHHIIKASLIFLVASARRTKYLAQWLVANARVYLRNPSQAFPRRLTPLKGRHSRAREGAPLGSDRHG